MKSSERADPAADEPTEKQRDQQGYSGEPQRSQHHPGGDDGGQGQKRVKMKIPLYSGLEIIFAGIVSLKEQDEEKTEEDDLRKDPKLLKPEIFFRLFSFQF